MTAEDRDENEQSGEYPSTTEGSGPASCSTPRWPQERPQCTIASETHRVRLIADISKLMHDPCVPEQAKIAGLTLIGWLARRQPGEAAHGYGVDEARTLRQRGRTRRAR